MASQHSTPARSKAAKGKPITAHPLFPAVVALWFGALFGLGSLAIRVGLLEDLVLATRIDTIVPAAGPPLGVSARILLALGLAAVGALLGAAIARRIARPKPEVRERKRTALAGQEQTLAVRARDAHPDAPTRRPISASEELGDARPEGLAAPVTGRRRTALTIEHEESFDLHEYAPLPGGMPQIHAAASDADSDDEALDLTDFSDSGLTADAFTPPPPAEQPQLAWPAEDQAAAASEATDAKQLFKAANAHVEAEPLNFSPPADAVSGRQVFGMKSPQPDEVLDELGITDAEFEEFHPVASPASEAYDTVPDAGPALLAAPVPAAPAASVSTADKPGMIDLAEQLGQALERRRARTAQAAALAAEAAEAVSAETGAPAIAAAPEPADPFAAFAHPNDLPAPFAVAQTAPVANAAQPVESGAAASPPVDPAPEPHPYFAIPAAMRPIEFDSDDDGDDDLPLASLLPPRSIRFAETVPPVVDATEAEDEAEEQPASADGFSSLLELGRAAPLRQNFIRIEEPAAPDAVEPVVIFPGHAALSSVLPPAIDNASESPEHGGEFRRFDAPGSAEAGQPVAAQSPSSHEVAETEQALRAALANLQRMSGAA